jgi:hypothetical protein
MLGPAACFWALFVDAYSDDSKTFTVNVMGWDARLQQALFGHFHQGIRPANKVARRLAGLRHVAQDKGGIQTCA